jgi:regulator of replication initiation timing
MAKGKYAARARTKQDADRRHAVAVAEGNELRRKIHELRHLRDENANLRLANDNLRAQITEGSSAREKEYRELLKKAVETMDDLHAKYQHDTAEQLKKWDQLLDELSPYPTTEAWWGAVTAVARQATRLSEEEKTLPHEVLKVRIKRTLRQSGGGFGGRFTERRRRRSLDRLEARTINKAISSEAVIREALANDA